MRRLSKETLGFGETRLEGRGRQPNLIRFGVRTAGWFAKNGGPFCKLWSARTAG
jgi:hypothetical protein